MDLHYKREVTVGTLVVLGFVAFVVGSMWLKGKDFKRGEHTRIVFPEVGNLKVASPVAVAGVQVGKVQSIELVDPEHVMVAISLPEKIRPKADATAGVRMICGLDCLCHHMLYSCSSISHRHCSLVHCHDCLHKLHEPSFRMHR